FDVPNPDGKLLPQMSAQVFFVKAAADNVLTIPVSALQAVQQRPGAGAKKRYTVQVLEDGQPQHRIITVGTMTRVSAEVLEGLEEGDEVVVSGGTSAPLSAERGQRRPRF